MLILHRVIASAMIAVAAVSGCTTGTPGGPSSPASTPASTSTSPTSGSNPCDTLRAAFEAARSDWHKEQSRAMDPDSPGGREVTPDEENALATARREFRAAQRRFFASPGCAPS